MAKRKLSASRRDDSARAFESVAGCAALRWGYPVVAALAFAIVSGLAPAGAAPLIDATGRTQQVASPVAVAIPAGVPAQVLLQAIAPGKLGALVEGFSPEHAIYVDPAIVGLPQIVPLTRSDAPGDVAAVAALKPGLVVDYGSLSPRYAAASEKTAAELKVPAVLFSGDLGDIPATVRALAEPLGVTERGEAVAKAAQGVLDALKPFAALPDDGRVAVYVARGADGLNALRAGTSLDEPIRLAGGRNVVTGGGGTFHHMEVAAVVALKPAVVVVSDVGALHSPLRDALPKGTRFVLDAGEPYKVLTGPPSLNRLVGAAGLAAILHPDKANADPEKLRRLETMLFPIPPGLAMPTPLQVSD